MKNTIGKLRYAVDKYGMIKNKDKIAVGVSGGKDSLTLLSLLVELKKYYSCEYDVLAVTIDPGFTENAADFSRVTDFCESLGVDHVVKRTRIADIVFESRKERNPCSLCSRMRNGVIHNVARENGCNKIALGHNLDDAIETFFMNIFNGGVIKCFSPVSYLTRKELWLVRPLVFCEEREIESFVKTNELPIVKIGCPVDGKTERQKIKSLIGSLERDYVSLKKKVINAIIKSGIDNWKGDFI